MLNEMRTCEAVTPRALRHGSDGRGIRTEWNCGLCGTNRNRPLETQIGSASRQCDYCLATNTFALR